LIFRYTYIRVSPTQLSAINLLIEEGSMSLPQDIQTEELKNYFNKEICIL
jgi:hypothetical protein